MCPPSSDDSLLARSTLGFAFQRIMHRRRRSIAGSPGSFASSSTGIVFTYGVLSEAIGPVPACCARSTTRRRIWRARSGPSWATTSSSASSHSLVSAASRSTPAPFVAGLWIRSVMRVAPETRSPDQYTFGLLALRKVDGVPGPPWARPLAGALDELVVESALLAD